MFSTIKLRLRLWKLRNEKQRYRREYGAALSAAEREKKSPEEIQELRSDWNMEFQLLHEQIGDIETSLIIREGEKYGVHVPIQQGNFGVWEQGRAYTDRYLTAGAIAQMRNEIRQEKRERWEEWTRWTPLVSALTGLLGVVVAIIALFHKM
jgi:hypothetical protein